LGTGTVRTFGERSGKRREHPITIRMVTRQSAMERILFIRQPLFLTHHPLDDQSRIYQEQKNVQWAEHDAQRKIRTGEIEKGLKM
jgi:hypothetical protein